MKVVLDVMAESLATQSFSSHESSSEDDNVLILAAVGLELEELEQRERPQRRRRWWVRPWIARREQFGAYHALMREIEGEDPESYVNFVRMDAQHFQQLLAAVTLLILKEETLMRDSIPPAERLNVTLRFLASGML